MSSQVRRQFDATPEAVREARLFLRAEMAGRVDPESQYNVTLALSELTTNAVRHAGTPFDVVVKTNGHIRIEVEDGSTVAPSPGSPSAEGGRGLAIVDWVCDRWGVDIRGETKCVWCECDLPDG